MLSTDTFLSLGGIFLDLIYKISHFLAFHTLLISLIT